MSFPPNVPLAGNYYKKERRNERKNESVNNDYYSLRFLRELDRKVNIAEYPKLTYPDVYVIDGGFKNFFETFEVHSFSLSPLSFSLLFLLFLLFSLSFSSILTLFFFLYFLLPFVVSFLFFRFCHQMAIINARVGLLHRDIC